MGVTRTTDAIPMFRYSLTLPWASGKIERYNGYGLNQLATEQESGHEPRACPQRRHWTFSRDGHHRPVHHQAARFLVVSVGAFLAGLALSAALVEGAGLAEVPAQAIAIVAVTPVSFLVNKLWSFAR